MGGLKYLWDTNTVIYYLQKNFSETEQASLTNIIYRHQPTISVITEIELQCWKTATENDLNVLKGFTEGCVVYELEAAVKSKTIDIRKKYNIKLPDAIIAATAIVFDITLITNDSGFYKITELTVVNPFNLVD